MATSSTKDLDCADEIIQMYVYPPNPAKQFPDLEEEDSVDEQLDVSQIGPRLQHILGNPVFSEAVFWGDIVDGDMDDDGCLFMKKMVDNTQPKTIRPTVPRMFHIFDFGKIFPDRVLTKTEIPIIASSDRRARETVTKRIDPKEMDGKQRILWHDSHSMHP